MDILNILEDKLSIFNGIYDSIRVINSETLEISESNNLNFDNFHCLDNSLCNNCLAIKAFKSNKPFRKLIVHNETVYLMTILPVNLNNEIFIVELFSNVTNNLILDSLEISPQNETIHDFFLNLNDKINIDPLTKCYNRNFLFANSGNKFSIKSPDSVSLIMLDLDFFKNINDTFGHLVGDSVLKNFSSRIMKFLKPKDCLYRYGGEEFLIVLDNESIAATKLFTLLLQEHFNTVPFILIDKELFLSCSMGVAFSTYKDSSLKELLEKADTNLYIAKNSGRNKIIF